jgi:V8-like Glu-specific endopeptidase
VTYSGEDRVQYLTDTLPGSSGSPVFDSEWNLVALHHSGGWMKEPGSFSKSTLFRNEGIAIQKVIDGLE